MVLRLSQITMKRIGLLLTFLFLFGQFHQCLPKFQRFDGGECVVCPTLPDGEGNHGKTIQNAHGDCHDCCVATDCSDRKKASSEALLFSAFHLDIALPGRLPLPLFERLEEVHGVVPEIEGHPPTGPPSRHASRAPPFFRFA